ncbi:hypothetical protein [Streptomyces sp. NPDC026673]|uniref:hypothetical protein n=1 Tax=Streptomyces sp. NPDC026673 TaxID=3155724 RepID=UPI0033C464A9
MSAASEVWAGLRERVPGLDEPLTAGEPAEPEGRIGVRLPEECRQFLPAAGEPPRGVRLSPAGRR